MAASLTKETVANYTAGTDWWRRQVNEYVISYTALALQSIFDIINAPASKSHQRLSLKFGMNSFQVRVQLPSFKEVKQ